MDKRKAAFMMAAVGAILAGAVVPLSSMAECYIYKFTTQPVTVETQPVTVRRFIDRIQPAVTFETPVMERTISRPVLMERSLEAPAFIDNTCGKCIDQPVVLENNCLSSPVMLDRTLSRPVILERSLSNPVLFDRPMRLHRYKHRVFSSAVTMSSSRGEAIQQLRTLGLPIVVDRNDVDDWNTVKIKRKKILGVRQQVLELKD